MKYLSSTYSCIAGHKWIVCTRCSCCLGKLMENQFVAWILSNKVYFIYFCRVLSGAFDKVVKVWSQDGQVMHKFDGFRFVAFTRYSHHLCGIIYSKMMTSLLFFYMVIGPQCLNSSWKFFWILKMWFMRHWGPINITTAGHYYGY